MTIEKIKLNTALLKNIIEIKDTLRSMIETSYHDNLKLGDNEYGDEIYRLDWSKYVF